jgi:hypothetical protein
MDLKSLLQEFAGTIVSETIERRQLLEFCSGKANLAEVTDFIKRVCDNSIISNSPTVYNTKIFKTCLDEHIEGEISQAEEIINENEFHIADGRGDPNQPDIVKTKSYRELEELIHPKYPLNIYISGETGLGKSTAVFGIAKKFNKPVIRVNLSMATDIDDLIGGIRIVDGNTVFDPGPVAIAMELGAILLLDEVDAGNPKILIDLHPVLEKKGVLAKKARKMIYPTKGFCVIATGNSKGVGDDTGKYIGVNNMNHAFLQRFGVALEFKPPTKLEMQEILTQALPELTKSIYVNLCNWYAHVLECHEAGSVPEYINPRKMIDIGTACLILGARKGTDTSTAKAVRVGLSLYDNALVESLVQLYETIVQDLNDEPDAAQVKNTEPSKVDEQGNMIPF